MARTNADGKDVRRVLEWLLNRSLTEVELADAVGLKPATYNRNKDNDDFPTFEDLKRFGEAFGLRPRPLQIAFGHRGLDELEFLDDVELRQYLEQGGANHPHPPLFVEVRRGGGEDKNDGVARKLSVRDDRRGRL